MAEKPSSTVVDEGCAQRHHVGFKNFVENPVSKGRVPIAVDRLDCASLEQHDWLSYKAIDSRYLSLVVS